MNNEPAFSNKMEADYPSLMPVIDAVQDVLSSAGAITVRDRTIVEEMANETAVEAAKEEEVEKKVEEKVEEVTETAESIEKEIVKEVEEVEEPSPAEEATTASTSEIEPAEAETVSESKSTFETTSEPAPAPPQEQDQFAVSNDLQAAMQAQSQDSRALRKEMEESVLKDLHTLDSDALRVRVTQLAVELFDRTRWEGIRLQQSLKQAEMQLLQQFEEHMAKERSALELKAARLLNEKETVLTEEAKAEIQKAIAKADSDLEEALRTQSEKFKETLAEELSKQKEQMVREFRSSLFNQVAMMLMQQNSELIEWQGKLDEVATKLKGFDSAVEATESRRGVSAKLHHCTAALLSLEDALAISKPVGGQIQAIKKLFADDPTVLSLIESIPKRLSDSGALSTADLRERFKVVRTEMRKAALAPPAVPSIVGQFVGTALANVSMAPEGYVGGSGVEETLSRVSYHLEHGQVPNAVEELRTVSGYEKKLCSDWVKLAEERIIADNTMRIIKSKLKIAQAALPKDS
jgi:mitofilin